MGQSISRPRIDSIKVELIPDEDAAIDWLGKHTDDPDEWNIVRVGEHAGQFVHDLPCEHCGKKREEHIPAHCSGGYCTEDDDSDEYTPSLADARTYRREYAFFKPYAGGEEQGTEDYRKYGLQDYKRMEGLNRGDWNFVGVQAKAVVSYDIGQGSRRIERLASGGLWGIESDSGDYFKEVADEELVDLERHLRAFNVRMRNFKALAAEAKEDMDV